MADSCKDLYKKHEALYEDWKKCWEEVGELKETALMADAGLLVACVGGAAATATVIGAGLGASACLLAIWIYEDAVSDLLDHYDECNKLAEEVNDSGSEYNECIEDHKNDP